MGSKSSKIWDKNNLMQINIKLCKTTEFDLILRLKQVDNKSQYIKQLIKQDIKH